MNYPITKCTQLMLPYFFHTHTSRSTTVDQRVGTLMTLECEYNVVITNYICAN